MNAREQLYAKWKEEREAQGKRRVKINQQYYKYCIEKNIYQNEHPDLKPLKDHRRYIL